MSYKVIDNFLDKQVFENIRKIFDTTNNFPWFYVNTIAHSSQKEDCFYFYHILYKEDRVNSNFYDSFLPLINKIKETDKAKALIRIKCNSYLRTPTPREDGWHTDFNFKHKGAIFAINTNNGGTIIEKKKIESVANRLILFDPSQEHTSISCTDEQRRLNINFNYL